MSWTIRHQSHPGHDRDGAFGTCAQCFGGFKSGFQLHICLLKLQILFYYFFFLGGVGVVPYYVYSIIHSTMDHKTYSFND